MKDVFIIGSKGIPANYGGYETFVHKLTELKKSKNIRYHVACMAKDDKEFQFNGARCFNVNTPEVGPGKAVVYDIKAIKRVYKYVKDNDIRDGILYILACRIGPFLLFYKRKLESIGIKVYINPDGHEWKRSKWNYFIKKYWKISERLMIKKGDLIICDSNGIESYIKSEYSSYKPRTTFIAYGADVKEEDYNKEDHDRLEKWYERHNLKEKEYYLIVGRFVPENNYKLMIDEFMKSNSPKDLVIITNVEKNKFYNNLLETTDFTKDKRIKFVGTIYDEKVLKLIREKSFGYLHGHEVGGTNPSLLEALATTEVNILLDVVFNREVALDSAVYFNKEEGSLKNTIEKVEKLSEIKRKELESEAKNRILGNYSWDYIIDRYETLFLNNKGW
ncbi:beta 1-4 rhamnosyltransferase Cps2T [Clostridium sp.]|uniref:beta 1-4 rhamnosyltransferase Cps2T n=1 Tax=Clostridium sp. TaxID=1506 RepID=UPI00346386B8